MSDESTRIVAVKFSDILDGFDFVNMGSDEAAAWVNLTTGVVRLKGMDGFLDDDEEADADDPEESDHYISLPYKNELDLGARLVMDFAAEVMPDDYDRISDIFRGKGAYRRLKDFLARRGKLEKWYEFEAAATEAALRAWCARVGIVLVD
jgi:hypothetical protein